jgi:hypothetical protein
VIIGTLGLTLAYLIKKEKEKWNHLLKDLLKTKVF